MSVSFFIIAKNNKKMSHSDFKNQKTYTVKTQLN